MGEQDAIGDFFQLYLVNRRRVTEKQLRINGIPRSDIPGLVSDGFGWIYADDIVAMLATEKLTKLGTFTRGQLADFKRDVTTVLQDSGLLLFFQDEGDPSHRSGQDHWFCVVGDGGISYTFETIYGLRAPRNVITIASTADCVVSLSERLQGAASSSERKGPVFFEVSRSSRRAANVEAIRNFLRGGE